MNLEVKDVAPGKISVTERKNGIKELVWHERLGHRNRRPYLFFVKDGKAIPFKGKSIPQVCVVKNYDFVKAGKWSSTYWTLLLSSGYEIYYGFQSFDGGRIFTGEYESWQDIADFYKTDLDSIKHVFEYFSPFEAETISKTEKEIRDFLA